MRLTSQRGVSLMLLIIAITVFAGVAIGIVTLLRSRYESYPYQVQSYQAYALANAGVEFAIRYIKDNNADPLDPNSFSQHPEYYINTDGTYKKFTFGNGAFYLKYVPGCPDMLYSKGMYGSATREVILSNFSLYTGEQGNSLYLTTAAVSRSCYGSAPNCNTQTCYNGTSSYTCPSDPYPGPSQYYGDRIQITYCNPYQSNSNYTLMLEAGANGPVGLVAATQSVTLSRLGFTDNVTSLPVVNGIPTPQTGHPLTAFWVWEATCGITDQPAAVQGTPPYCPTTYPMGQYGCPSTSPGGGGYYANRNLVDCDWSSATPHFNFPPLGALWDGTTDPPPAGVGYPYFWNTDTTTSQSTQYDFTCRPKKPCDQNPNDANYDPNCATRSQCTGMLWDTQCWQQAPWPPGGFPPGSNAVVFTGEYSCYDDEQSCSMGYGAPTERSRATCHFPSGSSGWPYGNPMPIRSFALNVNLNRITIETYGHLGPQIASNGPIKMYLAFYTYLSTGGSQNPVQPAVKNVFIFTVH